MIAIRTLALLTLLFASHAAALDLPGALRAAASRTAVVNAQLELDDAERTRQRTEADPLALRIDRLQAAQTAELAAAELRSARFEAYAEIADAYMQVLAVERQHAVAEMGVALAERSLEIARIRVERGAGTALEVREAENELADARNQATDARQGLDLARTSLASLIGMPADDLEPVPDAWIDTPIPNDDTLHARLEEAPTLLQARHRLTLAEASRGVLDPSYAPRRDLDQAELRIAQAEEALRETRRGLILQLQSLRDRVASAREALAVARDARANARDQEEIDRQRLEAGLIAEISFDSTRLATRQAEVAERTAVHDVVRALFDLQADAGIPLDGLDGF